MKICELILKNYGKFSDRHIELGEGINVLYGENESGKSTIHAFIRGMLFGMERGRGRAAVNDAFSIYEPWENPNYYSGTLRFESGGKIFRIDRNFDRYSKRAELICENDGEQLSIEDGDLTVLLGGLQAESYDNTISVRQMKVQTEQSLVRELRNFAMNCYTSGASGIDLEAAIQRLQEKRREQERSAKDFLVEKQQKRELLEQEASYVWRDVHRLEEEKNSLEEELEHRREKEEHEKNDREDVKTGMMDELRPAKWRIHPFEIILFAMIIVLPFALVSKPWSYLISIVLFLLSVIYVWNRMKVGKRPEKTEPEKILEEITSKEEKISTEQLEWSCRHLAMELKEKRIQYENLQEKLEELDEVGEDYRAYDKRKDAIWLAIERLQELSADMQKRMRKELDQNMSEIMCEITNGKYEKMLIDDELHVSLMSGGRRIVMEQVSRGTVEQVYFALRMASGNMLQEEELPIILDDTFAFYDDERLRATLNWLAKSGRQVIIFTCQKREEQLLKDMGIPIKREEI